MRIRLARILVLGFVVVTLAAAWSRADVLFLKDGGVRVIQAKNHELDQQKELFA